VKTFDALFAELADKAVARPAGRRPLLRSTPACIRSARRSSKSAEVWMAAEHESADRTAEEISQLLYHLQVLMLARGLTPQDVYTHL
jgi:phosphoribosyl-ATP pyrophosphohydrolase